MANAEELVNSAWLLKGRSTAHIRYHLAVLALEEVGKAVLLSVEFTRVALDAGDTELSLTIDDHVKKLFWAIFSPFVEQKRLTNEDFESYRGFARETHERRLESLYTDLQAPLLPQDRIEEEEADGLVRLAESRINLEKGVDIDVAPDESKLEDLHWFHSTSNEPEKRHLIFNNASLDKLAELGDVYEWIKWLRQEFTKWEEESREILRQEMEKGKIGEGEGDEPKWKVKFRIYSASHSIRPKALNKWNEISGLIKLYNPNKKRKNELICDLTLSKNIPVQGLWNAGRKISRYFVAALNIATRGLFWWHVDKDIARYYEKIWDLENDAEVRVEITPRLSIDWGRLALAEDNLRDTGFVFAYLLHIVHFSHQRKEALELYLTGLALMSKNDIHLRLETSAFEHFFRAFKVLSLASGDWDGIEDLKLAVGAQLNEVFSSMLSLSDYIKLGGQLEKRNNPSKLITLTEVVGMKVYCDVYFCLLAKREHPIRIERK